ncbi:hypothetical protein OPV22_010311 [Ensete ventricosum]|uniref:Protein kinase domain-containing protein n=1 Tax=Ensete ventricosum TaxID=4639 RepID=A0AAV8RCU8_ENSVE|nr:hypothetical protein OPV22_010311 [Ensete ventricosum]
MGKRSPGGLSTLLWIFLVCQRWRLSDSLNGEGRALLALKGKVEVDPYGALANWDEEDDDPCAWCGVECTDDGRVVVLNLKNLCLKGTLSPEVGKLIHLNTLILHNNSFYGAVPVVIGELQMLKVLDLEHNNFSGVLPSDLGDVALDKLDVVSATTRGLLGVELKQNGDEHDNKNLGPPDPSANSKSPPPPPPVVSVMPLMTVPNGQSQKPLVTGVPALRRSELETACEDFSNIIDSLSNCKLYKGTLSSGVEIAVTSAIVTSAKDWSVQDEAHFRKKISELSKVNHKNFMNLLGHCEEEVPFTRMMVFEYAPSGTLFEHLHIKEAEHLNWTARLRIAMGLAYCLEHMMQLNPPPILRNLNSSSIYLTEDNAAKISDLEFWNVETEADWGSSEITKESSTVYKFGIILLEIISGRLPYSEDDGLLVLWARSYLSGKRPIKDMVDATLDPVPDEGLNALVEVIQSCINEDPNERPTMKEVADRMMLITAIPPEEASPKLSPLWWAELQIISSEAT